ncbi:hypothetical protein ACLOJK_021954 [Asimina triloba]
MYARMYDIITLFKVGVQLVARGWTQECHAYAACYGELSHLSIFRFWVQPVAHETFLITRTQVLSSQIATPPYVSHSRSLRFSVCLSLIMANNTHIIFLYLLLLPLQTLASTESLRSCLKGDCGTPLLSCLASGGVTNVTVSNTRTYHQFLGYSLQNLRYASPSNNKPYAVIMPETTQQLANIIKCARAGSWDIRLRSGGHSFEGMSSVSDNPFIIIDMMNMNRVTVDLDTETAWVEAGTTVGELYHAIGTASNRHAFPAGICPTVGVGGHISGGGYGGLTRKFGLAADNVVDAVLVDAEGRVLDREAMGEEVFWAIRGGGGGTWGAVASWKIRLVEIPETVAVFHAARTGSVDESAELWNKWQSVGPDLVDEFFLMVFITPEIESAGITMSFLGLYLGPKPSALEHIHRDFPELAITEDECVEMRWVETAVYLWGEDSIDYLKDRSTFHKTFTKSKADVVRGPVAMDGIRGILEMYSKQPKGSFRLEAYGGVMNRIRSDATPFPHRAGSSYMIEYFVDWNEEDDGKSDEYLDWLRGVYEFMAPYVSNNPRAVCANNIDFDLGVMDWSNSSIDTVEMARPWGEKYFMGNFDRLVRAKTSIDPNNVFSHKQSIPPLPLGLI